MIIDGKKISEEIIDDLKKSFKFIDNKKFFGALLVGEDNISLNFLKQKERIAQKLSLDFRIYRLEQNITTDELRTEIGKLSRPKNCGAFTVQLPLPAHINTHYVLNAIPKEKDIDVLSEHSLGAYYTGRSKILPPSVEVLKEILQKLNINISNLKVAIVGYGFLIGKPIAFWISSRVKELAIFDSKNQDLNHRLKEFDLIISGAGRANLFGSKDLKNKTMVIDFGYSVENNKICGDFNPQDASAKEIIYTPTPGGTGPILVAKLFENFLKLNQQSR